MKQAMRAGAVLLAVLATAGCEGVKEAFSSGGGSAAATAGKATLSPEQLGNLLGSAQGVTLDTAAAELVATLWTDYALFAQAVATKQNLKDSAFAVKALWPTISEIKAARFHDTLLAKRAPVNAGVVDSLYGKSDLRVLQHILVRGEDGTDAAVQAKARSVLAEVKAGGNFGALAAKYSADGSAQDQGYLPPSGKGAFVPEFEKAGWALAPGATTELVKSQFGYHIIRRPTLDEVRSRLEAYARQSMTQAADSAIMAEMTTTRKIAVVKGAGAKAKAALKQGGRGSSTALVTYEGGPLTTSRFLEWASTAPPQFKQQFSAAPDSLVEGFLKNLAQNDIIIEQADSAKVGLTADEWTRMYGGYTEAIDSAAAALGVKEGTTAEETAKLVQGFFEKLVIGQARLRPLPAALPWQLRGSMRAKLNPAGLGKALEIAKGIQGKNAPAAPSPMQPAPGGPPVGGEAPPAAPEAGK